MLVKFMIGSVVCIKWTVMKLIMKKIIFGIILDELFPLVFFMVVFLTLRFGVRVIGMNIEVTNDVMGIVVQRVHVRAEKIMRSIRVVFVPIYHLKLTAR